MLKFWQFKWNTHFTFEQAKRTPFNYPQVCGASGFAALKPSWRSARREKPRQITIVLAAHHICDRGQLSTLRWRKCFCGQTESPRFHRRPLRWDQRRGEPDLRSALNRAPVTYTGNLHRNLADPGHHFPFRQKTMANKSPTSVIVQKVRVAGDEIRHLRLDRCCQKLTRPSA